MEEHTAYEAVLLKKKKKKKKEPGKTLGLSTSLWKPKLMELYHREAISKIQNEGNSIGQKKLGFIKNKMQEKEEGAIY